MDATRRGLRGDAMWRSLRRPLRGSLLTLTCVVAATIAPAVTGQQRPPRGLLATRAADEDVFLRVAGRALTRGRLDEAEALATVRGAQDPAAAAIRGRVARARGRLAEAEQVLTPAANADPQGEAALELGLLLARVGRTAESERRIAPILEAARWFRTSGDLLRAARAALALDQVRDANTYFRNAAAAAPRDPAVNTAWGELFLEKHQPPDALRSFRTAIEADEEWAPAHLGVARTLVEENPPAARKAAERALAINPTYAAAHLFVAELALDAGRHDEARAAIGRALEADPSSLEARALLAAIAHLEGRTADFDAEVKRALAMNPTYGEIYRVAGDFAARNYRFDEAVALVRKAIALDPDNTRAFADLGVHLLRTGDEAAARDALERSFRADPFDQVTYNLLGLLDTLKAFETIREGDLVVRLHPEEAAVLREYAIPLAERALGTLSKKYGFTPRGPILIEVFPRHDDFAVRNVGLPGMIGALGACFGRVVTMDSPRAQQPGTFSWQATLWHELAHVVTLQMSNQRVPRWLTEGISVYEETRARPEWGRDAEIALARALERGEVLKLRDLNAGFTRPETIALAYFQASLLVEHLVATYGEAVLPAVLRGFGRGLDEGTALREAVGVDLDGLQASFDAALEKRFGALRRALRGPEAPAAGDRLTALRGLAAANPGSYPVQLALGQALYAAGELAEATKALERASALVPMATGEESPRALLAEIAQKQGNRERAIRELAALLQHDHTTVEAARTLAALAEEARDETHRRLAYERIVELDPFDASAHGALGRLSFDRGELDTAIREFRAALAAGPVDPVSAHCDLAETYLKAGRAADAKRQAVAALELAPTYERAQELLLKAIEGSR